MPEELSQDMLLSLADKPENFYELEAIIHLYIERLKNASIKPTPVSLSNAVEKLLRVDVVTIPLLIIKTFPEVIPEFQKQHGLSIAEYVKSDRGKYTKPTILSWANCNIFTVALYREVLLFFGEHTKTLQQMRHHEESRNEVC